MPIFIIAVIESLFYILAIPVNVAVRLDGLRFGSGVAAFDAVAARHRALAALAGKNRKRRGGQSFSNIWPILRRLRFERVELTGRVSLGDAARTALLCGALNGLGRGLRARADRLRVDVRPDFSDAPRFELRGMVCARTGQIMLAAIRARKGRFFSWTSIPSKAS